MEEALLNLLKNAIEHSKPGGNIMIQVKNSPIYIELVIQGFGEGILAEELPHIFERFYKSSSSKSLARMELGWHLSKLLFRLTNILYVSVSIL